MHHLLHSRITLAILMDIMATRLAWPIAIENLDLALGLDDMLCR